MTIDGPSKVKMDCQDCPEGYKVSYTPMAPGSYLISIKYGGPQHIVGSPFKAKVSGGSMHHRPLFVIGLEEVPVNLKGTPDLLEPDLLAWISY